LALRATPQIQLEKQSAHLPNALLDIFTSATGEVNRAARRTEIHCAGYDMIRKEGGDWKEVGIVSEAEPTIWLPSTSRASFLEFHLDIPNKERLRNRNIVRN
jgi:hypothetical protein